MQTYKGFKKGHAHVPRFPKTTCKRARVSKRDSKRARRSTKSVQTCQGFKKGHANVPGFPKSRAQTYQGFKTRHANIPGFPKKACKRFRVSKRDMLTCQGFQGFQKHACKRTQVSKRGMQTRQGFQKPRQTMLRSTMADLKLSSPRIFFCRGNAQNQRQKKSSSAWS